MNLVRLCRAVKLPLLVVCVIRGGSTNRKRRLLYEPLILGVEVYPSTHKMDLPSASTWKDSFVLRY